MVDRFISYATGPAARAGEPGAVVRRGADGGLEMVNLVWGFAPAQGGGKPFTVYRAEGRRFGARRCLIPASEFTVSKGRGEARRKWRVTLVDGDWFYFAGTWRPAEGGWPASYAILTCAANPDIAPYHDRQMAVVRRADRWGWLDHLAAQERILQPWSAGRFRLEQIEGPGEQLEIGLAAA